MSLDRHGTEQLFRLFSQCCKQARLIITMNLPLTDWLKVFACDQRIPGALPYRRPHHVHIVAIEGDSFQLKTRVNKTKKIPAKKGDKPLAAMPWLILSDIKLSGGGRHEQHRDQCYSFNS